MRLEPIEAAKRFIKIHFPNCLGAILSGSVVRGEQNETSDLDIIVIESTPHCYRETLIKFDWMIEVFVYDIKSYKSYFENDFKRSRPTLIRMIAEGIVIKKHPELDRIIGEAKQILLNGPESWDDKSLKSSLYFLSDTLTDFIGSENRMELICISSTLLERLHEFILRTNKKWIGSSKWMYRELKQFDEQLTIEIFNAFDLFYKTNEKEKVILIVERIIASYGGRYFEGYKIGK